MRRTASEMINELELRVARLERQAGSLHNFNTLWSKREKYQQRFPTFGYGEIKKERYLQADKLTWAEIFNDRRIRDFNVPRNAMLYILEDTHDSKRDEFFWLVNEDQISVRPDRRRGWEIYV